MPTLLFFMQVIIETSRLATVVNGVLRKTTQDMELSGKISSNCENARHCNLRLFQP